jgi:hypothetical protein
MEPQVANRSHCITVCLQATYCLDQLTRSLILHTYKYITLCVKTHKHGHSASLSIYLLPKLVRTTVKHIVTCVTYKIGFGLNDSIYCTLYSHTTQDYRQYSPIAILHTFQFTVTYALEFSVFTSRILPTDL